MKRFKKIGGAVVDITSLLLLVSTPVECLNTLRGHWVNLLKYLFKTHCLWWWVYIFKRALEASVTNSLSWGTPLIIRVVNILYDMWQVGETCKCDIIADCFYEWIGSCKRNLCNKEISKYMKYVAHVCLMNGLCVFLQTRMVSTAGRRNAQKAKKVFETLVP